jgi:hypothetical protein
LLRPLSDPARTIADREAVAHLKLTALESQA